MVECEEVTQMNRYGASPFPEPQRRGLRRRLSSSVGLEVLPDVAVVYRPHFGIGLVVECQMAAELGSNRRSETFGGTEDSLGGGSELWLVQCQSDAVGRYHHAAVVVEHPAKAELAVDLVHLGEEFVARRHLLNGERKDLNDRVIIVDDRHVEQSRAYPDREVAVAVRDHLRDPGEPFDQ